VRWFSEVNESSVAELLARALRDETFWSIGETPPDDAAQREALAAEALALYEATAPLYAERVRLSWTPFDTALYVLRNVIGDRCAILSYEWDLKVLKHFTNIPTRLTVERYIRRGDVEEWATRHGHPLGPMSHERGDELSLRSLWRARKSKRQVADEFCMVDRQYEALQERRKDWPVWVTRSPLVQKAAVTYIAASRNSLKVLAGKEARGGYAVATATDFIAQGIFVVAHAPRETSEFFPTREFIRRFLEETAGGHSWLTRHAKEVPAWLR
jgi:hypothetical protein